MTKYDDEFDCCVICTEGKVTPCDKAKCKEEWEIVEKALSLTDREERTKAIKAIKEEELRECAELLISEDHVRPCPGCKKLRKYELEESDEYDPDDKCLRCTELASHDRTSCLVCENELPCDRELCKELEPKVLGAIRVMSKLDKDARSYALRALEDVGGICSGCDNFREKPDDGEECIRCRLKQPGEKKEQESPAAASVTSAPLHEEVDKCLAKHEAKIAAAEADFKGARSGAKRKTGEEEEPTKKQKIKS